MFDEDDCLSDDSSWSDCSRVSKSDLMYAVVDGYKRSQEYTNDREQFRILLQQNPLIIADRLRTLHSNNELSRFALMKEISEHIEHDPSVAFHAFSNAGLLDLLMDFLLDERIYVLGLDVNVCYRVTDIFSFINVFITGLESDAGIPNANIVDFVPDDRLCKTECHPVKPPIQYHNWLLRQKNT